MADVCRAASEESARSSAPRGPWQQDVACLCLSRPSTRTVSCKRRQGKGARTAPKPTQRLQGGTELTTQKWKDGTELGTPPPFPTSTRPQSLQSPALTRSRTLSTIDEEGDHDQDVVIRILAENAKLRDQLKYELKETNERLTKMEDITKRQDKASADIADECDRQIQSIQFALTDNKDAQSKQ
uniref:Uncharacterized protein n=1 Tax=Branchiostoma floridae TaxID=7739 RepID=C3ZFW4_BRAFL|eukprot:XP_002592591.1 hypothetical protein BRAFLDRAFT_68914 [Branchiostoma floridae]